MEAAAKGKPSPVPSLSLDPEVLFREGQRLRALAAQQAREVDEAVAELRRQYEALRQEREQFERQREEFRRRWEQRWQEEWQRLQQREAEIETTRQKSLAEFRRVQGDLELQRRQLQEAWQQLHRAEQAWRQRRAVEEADLARQRQELVERQEQWQAAQAAFQDQAALQEALVRSSREELTHLETRIRNYRHKLEALREEVALLEAGLSPVSEPGTVEPNQPGTETGAKASQAHPVPSPFAPLVEGLAQVAVALLDESQRLLESQQRMAAVKHQWEADWLRVAETLQQKQADLSDREEALRRREQAVLSQEQQAARRLAECSRAEYELQTREIALAYQQGRLARRQARWNEHLRNRQSLLRNRFLFVHRLRKRWEHLIQSETERLVRLRTASDQARHEYLTAREMLRQREGRLDAKEQELVQRELALAQIEQALIESQPNPAAVQEQLQRLTAQWEASVRRQLQSTQRREAELARRAERLERLRQRILEQRQGVEELYHRAVAVEAEAAAQRERYRCEAACLEGHLERLQKERHHLLERVRQQEQQIEHLVLHLLEGREEPPSLAAAA